VVKLGMGLIGTMTALVLGLQPHALRSYWRGRPQRSYSTREFDSTGIAG
jgi:hypothetical protein